MDHRQYRTCKVCSQTVWRGGSVRHALTAVHHVAPTEARVTTKQRRCPGSDLRWAEQLPLADTKLNRALMESSRTASGVERAQALRDKLLSIIHGFERRAAAGDAIGAATARALRAALAADMEGRREARTERQGGTVISFDFRAPHAAGGAR